MSSKWLGRITAETYGDWNVYVDGVLIGRFSFEDTDPRDDCYDEASDCPLAYVTGEGDVDVIGGWHEWATCDPDLDRCALLIQWQDELAEVVEDPQAFDDWCVEADDIAGLCNDLKYCAEDCHCDFIPA